VQPIVGLEQGQHLEANHFIARDPKLTELVENQAEVLEGVQKACFFTHVAAQTQVLIEDHFTRR